VRTRTDTVAGAIEPHGLLLVFRAADLQIAQASVNTEIHLGIAPEAVLGMHAADIFASADVDRLAAGPFQEGKRRYLGRIAITARQKLFDASMHKHQELLIVELEPSSLAVAGNDFDVYESLTGAMGQFDGRLGLSELCQRVASIVRQVTGLDRVMVYRFLEDDSGWVIAEDRRADLAPYLGLRYPAPPTYQRRRGGSTCSIRCGSNRTYMRSERPLFLR
jgi:two-component system, chemotaxis family, sensor kinase Cph1